jgi:hypothetical protein
MITHRKGHLISRLQLSRCDGVVKSLISAKPSLKRVAPNDSKHLMQHVTLLVAGRNPVLISMLVHSLYL